MDKQKKIGGPRRCPACGKVVAQAFFARHKCEPKQKSVSPGSVRETSR